MPIRHRFGQHFLLDPHALQRLVDALELSGNETVVEIGPGRGALTDRLVHRCRRLVAIEIDRDLAAGLRIRYRDETHVEIVDADVLSVDLAQVAGGPFVLTGNVPYYITTPILFHAMRPPRPLRAVFLVQKEVGERLQAAPGGRAYGALTVNVALVSEVDLVATVGAGAFFPRPKVESAIVRFRIRPHPLVPDERAGAVRAFVIALFGQRRRQLVRAVRTVSGLDAAAAQRAVAEAGLDPHARPETLTPPAFVALQASVEGARA